MISLETPMIQQNVNPPTVLLVSSVPRGNNLAWISGLVRPRRERLC